MSADRQQFREYLLGKMPETVAVDFDARLFEQNTLHDELEQERESLIEDFVHGQLPTEEESLFRHSYRSLPNCVRESKIVALSC